MPADDGVSAMLAAAWPSPLTRSGWSSATRRRSGWPSVLDLHTVGDLLGYYPRRYDKRGELTDLAGLREGDYVTVQAEVASSSVRKMSNRPGSIFEAVVTDGHGKLTLTFFGHGRQDWRERRAQPGCPGPVLRPGLQLPRQAAAHPSGVRAARGWQRGCPGRGVRQRADPGLPGQRPAAVLEDRRRRFALALDVLDVPGDPLPAVCGDRHGLSGYADALRGIHRPVDEADVARARPAAEVGRGLHPAGTARPAQAGRHRLQRYPATGGRRRAARRLRPRRSRSS